MAEGGEPLFESLVCPICVDTFTEPVVLPCQGQHRFCRQCLQSYGEHCKNQKQNGGTVTSASESQVITCPICRQLVDLGVKGVAGLPVQPAERQRETARTGITDGAMDSSELCDDHGLAIVVFCGSCRRPLCINCFKTHNGHPLKDVGTLYREKADQAKEKITALNKLMADVKEMLADLNKLQEKMKETKSLHIDEIEQNYTDISKRAEEWRRVRSQEEEQRHEKWRLVWAAEEKHLKIKLEELTSLLRFSNEQLYGPHLRAIKGHEELMRRLNEQYTSAMDELRRHKDESLKCRDEMDRDVVMSENLCLREETISTPKLRFTEKITDCVIIKDNHTVLVSVKQENDVFKGALTNGRFRRGSYYWELELTFKVKKTQGKDDLVYSAGVVRKGSDLGHYVGRGNLSWGVDVSYCDDEFKFVCEHNGEPVSAAVPVYPLTANHRDAVRQGLYLNCEERTLTIIDVTNNRVLYIFRDLDLSEPLTPAVCVNNYGYVNVSVRIIPCNLSGLVKVLHNSLK